MAPRSHYHNTIGPNSLYITSEQCLNSANGLQDTLHAHVEKFWLVIHEFNLFIRVMHMDMCVCGGSPIRKTVVETKDI